MSVRPGIIFRGRTFGGGRGVLPRLHGIGSHLVKRELTSYRAGPGEPKVVLEARHLGPHCHHQYKAHLERDRRIAAVRKSAPAAFGLWRSDAGYTTKRSALTAHVVGPQRKPCSMETPTGPSSTESLRSTADEPSTAAPPPKRWDPTEKSCSGRGATRKSADTGASHVHGPRDGSGG